MKIINLIKKAQIPQLYSYGIVVVILGLVTYVFHHSALSGFWRIDDGTHLKFAALHSAWEYFFVPDITGQQSGHKFVTPWNVFFYDINLWLFGLNPKGFYAHQLIIIWGTSIATYFFIRFWGSTQWALFGSFLFLLGAPTVHIAQELMTGHYAAGLLFSILALYYYISALRKQNKWLALTSAFFYLLATTCKEIYVPLIGILLFIPEGNLKRRLFYAIPFALVALMYVYWRYNVLGGYIGGYNHGPPVINLDNIWIILNNFLHIPYVMLGSGNAGMYVLAILVVISIAYFIKNIDKSSYILVGLVLILLPLIPIWQCIGGSKQRFIFLPWWSFSVYCAILFAKQTKFSFVSYILSVSMLILVSFTSYTEMTVSPSAAVYKCHDAVTRFALNSSTNQVFYDSHNVWYPSSAVATPLLDAEKIIDPASPIRAYIVPDINIISVLNLNRKDVFGYDELCQCVKKINKKLPALLIQKNIKRMALYVDLKHDGKYLNWSIGPYEKGIYKVIMRYNSKCFSISTVSKSGSIKAKAADFYLRYESPEGWSTYSELIHFDSKENSKLQWSTNY